MQAKLKSTVSGLAVVALFVFGSALLGEPLPPSPPAVVQIEAEVEVEPIVAALDEAQAQARAAAESARSATLRRLRLTMPYFVVGHVLAVARES